MSLIKNHGLIVSKSTSGNRNTFVLKNESATGVQLRLGDVFNYLPHGVVVKSETGMGATTLEIMAERNSIIVEPLRFTAQSKAEKSRDYLYVGTPMRGRNTTKKEEILRYLQNSAILHKKIICVVNSLTTVLNTVQEAGMPISDFFLMLDETDSLQLDSTYRKEMNEAFEIYKTFHPENRATVTATPLKFSDPELATEPETEFRYEKIVPREISLIHTEDYKAQVYEEISEILLKQPTQKIFIALNGVADCMDVADHLVKKKITKASEIRILCSSSSKRKARGWYSEINSEKLPGQINFVTAAYYTGFDLQESYHLIVVISAGSQTLELSELRYKQIAGRCRTLLFSERIIYQGEGLRNSDYHDLDKLSTLADAEIRAINCLKTHYGTDEVHVRDHMLKIRSEILKGNGINRTPLVFENSENDLKKAYAAFDSILESTRLRKEVFSVIGGMKKSLDDLGFNVTEFKKVPSADVGKSTSLRRNGRETLEIIDDVFMRYFLAGEHIDPKDHPGFSQTVFEMFHEYRGKIEENYLRTKLQEGYSSEEGGKKRLKNLKVSLNFAVTDDTEPFKSLIKSNFKKGGKYSKDFIIQVMTNSLARLGNNANQGDQRQEAWTFARRIFNLKDRNKEEFEIVDWVIDPSKILKLTVSS